MFKNAHFLEEQSPKGAIRRFYVIALCLVTFTIPFPYIISSISLGILGIAWVFTGIWRNLRQLVKRPLLWPWILFFVLHCISYFYSTDKEESLFDIQSKISFILIPLILGTGPDLNREDLVKILKCFIFGVVYLAFLATVYAVYSYFVENDIGVFFYNDLVRITEHNAVYIAWYTITAIFLLIVCSYSYFRMNVVLYCSLLVFLQCFFLALSARLLIGIEAIILLPTSIIAFRKHRQVAELAIVLIFITAMIVIAFTSNPITKRYKIIAPSHTTNWIIDKHDDSTYQQFTNVTLRLFLWKTALESIDSNKYYYYGCGNGDLRINQKISIAKYEKNLNPGNRQAELWKYNIHNMYIHILYILGFPGLLIMLVMVIIPLFIRHKEPYKLFHRVFLIISALFMCIEAPLQTQSGIIFFTFFSILMYKAFYSMKSPAETSVS